MQIFTTSKCPTESALRLWSNPTRARKMITESMQILACCQRSIFGDVTILRRDGIPYKTAKPDMNHPVVIWARSDLRHMNWVTYHCMSLYAEYARRGGKAFINIPDNLKILTTQLLQSGKNISIISIEYCNFAKAKSKGLDFRHIENVQEAYNQFLIAQGA